MKLEPLNDVVVLKRVQPVEKTKGGLIIPAQAQFKRPVAEVVACGPGKMLQSGERSPMGVKPGDTVFVTKYTGTEIEVDGVEMWFVREGMVLSVVKDLDTDDVTGSNEVFPGDDI